MTDVIARLWFTPKSRTVSADFLQKRLAGNLGCTVSQVSGGAGSIPILRITSPLEMEIHPKNDDSIAAQAIHFADTLRNTGANSPAIEKLCRATRVLEIHATTKIDPQTDPLRGILIGLISGLDGILEDRIHSRLVMAPPRKTSLLGRLFAR